MTLNLCNWWNEIGKQNVVIEGISYDSYDTNYQADPQCNLVSYIFEKKKKQTSDHPKLEDHSHLLCLVNVK